MKSSSTTIDNISHRDMRGGAIMVHVISGIDMALWDITGKLWGVPVYRLLGGPLRDKVRMYPSPKANKLGTGGPHPFSGNPGDVMGLVKGIENLRKQKGPDFAIMFDAPLRHPAGHADPVRAAVEPYNILWLEEPACPGNIEVFKRLKQQIRIPIALGERDRTIWEVIVLSAEPLHRHSAARRGPDRRHQPDAEDRRPVRGLPRAAGAAQHLLGAGPVGQRPLPPRRRRCF